MHSKLQAFLQMSPSRTHTPACIPPHACLPACLTYLHPDSVSVLAFFVYVTLYVYNADIMYITHYAFLQLLGFRIVAELSLYLLWGNDHIIRHYIYI